MRCPFPGMDPFLERSGVWEDFHRSFLTYTRDAALAKLPPTYDARLDEYFQLVNVAGGEPDQRRYPDVAVTRTPGAPAVAESAGGTATLVEPIVLTHKIAWDEETAAWLEIHSTGEEPELITVIELLSPTNKTGDGYKKYVARREQFLSRSVSLVEIDLLLRGHRLRFDSPLPEADYYVYVTRGEKPTHTAVYPWRLTARLPTVPVPLRAPDPDLPLDMADLFATTFDRGRYERRLKYRSAEASGLQGDELDWARSVVAASPVQSVT